MNRPGAGADAGPEVRLRTLRILWVMFLVTIGLLFLVTYFARPDAETRAEMAAQDSNLTILLVLAAIALSSVVTSFIMKATFYRRAAEQQQPAMLQTGFIIAIAMCESAVLLGLVGVFTTWNDYAYGLFALGALGEALHFPRREEVLSAYYKPTA